MRGVLRYLPRHFLDLLMTRGTAIVLVGFMFLLPLVIESSGTEADADIAEVLGTILMGSATFFTLIATYGLIGQDFRQGYYRFVFAKPISPVVYYAISLVLTTVVFLLGTLGTIGIAAVMIRPVWPGAVVLEMLANHVLLGSLVFVFSRLTNGDWLLAMVVLGLAALTRYAYPPDESLVGGVLDLAFPPTDTGVIFRPEGVQWDQLTHVLAYSAVMIVLALVTVSRYPMGADR